MPRVDIRLIGFGGQGIIAMGTILSRAAGIYAGKNIVQTQTYGGEVRGGFSRCDVVISDEEIDYPRVLMADFLVALSQRFLDRHINDVKKSGVLLADADLVKDIGRQDIKIFKVPATKMSLEELGNRNMANVLMLGVLTGLAKVVPKDSVEKAVLEFFASKSVDTQNSNLKAFERGFRLSEGL